MSLPLPAIHRGLQAGAGKYRISAKGDESAREAVEEFLRMAIPEAAEILKLQKKVTVTKDVLAAVFVKQCHPIKLLDLSSAKRSGEMRGLPQARVERIFKSKLPKGTRLSGDAGEILVNIAEAYLRMLGAKAVMFARSAGRVTLLETDIVSARQLMKI